MRTQTRKILEEMLKETQKSGKKPQYIENIEKLLKIDESGCDWNESRSN